MATAPEPMDEWKTLPWPRLERAVFKLQTRIVSVQLPLWRVRQVSGRLYATLGALAIAAGVVEAGCTGQLRRQCRPRDGPGGRGSHGRLADPVQPGT